MSKYDHQAIESKWQKKWDLEGLYKTGESQDKQKYYILDMFPYPSGSGLHVGHPRGYIATDVFARMKVLQGYNVLHPMGWDAFGLPAENYAIKNKVHPKQATNENIATFKKQLQKIGFSYDWDREIDTTDPDFYKWTQWIFLQLWKKGLAYQSYEPINWCSGCQTGLANEDLEDGRCERCDSEIEQKPMRQWVLKITDYADRLLNDLDKLPDWDSSIKEMQKNWIGKSEGAEIDFKIGPSSGPEGSGQMETVKVFTTRPDTLFGATYFVLAPEHPVLEKNQDRIENIQEVREYMEKARKKTELERTDLSKDKTGLRLEGLVAINPVNKEEIPIFVADYVMIHYGTGAIMAVPAHDERDFEFAQKYGLPIKKVVEPKEKDDTEDQESLCFSDSGVNVNSDFLDGLETAQAQGKMIEWLEKNGLGKKEFNYKIKDWVFSRQRYWGEPIPIIHCDRCGVVGVPEAELPVELPEIEHYEPSGTGESPLVNVSDWVNTECPECQGVAKRETNTMPQWAGSSWYYLRYIDPFNQQALVDPKKEKYWSPVDFYVGGAEHATRHLIYARFWHKFLYDQGVVNYDEPFKRLQHVGIILAEDGRKMSKRFGNVINPDEIVFKYGADALRVYEMFMGPFSQSIAWSTNGLIGVKRFLEKIHDHVSDLLDEKKRPCLSEELSAWKKGEAENDPELLCLLHQTIKKVGRDIEGFKFNTAISQMMILRNSWDEDNFLAKKDLEKFLIILSPFAPHLAEELWQKLGHEKSIFAQTWPDYDPELISKQEVEIVVQVNGKLRDRLMVSPDLGEEEVLDLVLERDKVQEWLKDKKLIKKIFVPGKLVNLVVK